MIWDWNTEQFWFVFSDSDILQDIETPGTLLAMEQEREGWLFSPREIHYNSEGIRDS